MEENNGLKFDPTQPRWEHWCPRCLFIKTTPNKRFGLIYDVYIHIEENMLEEIILKYGPAGHAYIKFSEISSMTRYSELGEDCFIEIISKAKLLGCSLFKPFEIAYNDIIERTFSLKNCPDA